MTLRSSHSEKAFRFYEPTITAALAVYPGPLKHVPSGSVETFAARFRDARRSGIENGWLLDARPLSVAMRSGYVLIGTPDSIRSYDKIPAVLPKEPSEISVDFSDFACAAYLCELIKRKAFGYQPIAFTVGPLSPVDVLQLETDFGVTLVPIPNRPETYTLL